jgi:hypothetical protein
VASAHQVGLHLLDGGVRDGQAELLLGDGEVKPKLEDAEVTTEVRQASTKGADGGGSWPAKPPRRRLPLTAAARNPRNRRRTLRQVPKRVCRESWE